MEETPDFCIHFNQVQKEIKMFLTVNPSMLKPFDEGNIATVRIAGTDFGLKMSKLTFLHSPSGTIPNSTHGVVENSSKTSSFPVAMSLSENSEKGWHMLASGHSMCVGPIFLLGI